MRRAPCDSTPRCIFSFRTFSTSSVSMSGYVNFQRCLEKSPTHRSIPHISKSKSNGMDVSFCLSKPVTDYYMTCVCLCTPYMQTICSRAERVTCAGRSNIEKKTCAADLHTISQPEYVEAGHVFMSLRDKKRHEHVQQAHFKRLPTSPTCPAGEKHLAGQYAMHVLCLKVLKTCLHASKTLSISSTL